MPLPPQHNDLGDLGATLRSLGGLQRLQAVSLAGNPFCLLPTYQHALRRGLPKSVLLVDSQVGGGLLAGSQGPGRGVCCCGA